MKELNATIKLKRNSAADWKLKNPILKEGEPGFEIDTGKLKIGNGEKKYNDLNYINSSGTGSTGEDGGYYTP